MPERRRRVGRAGPMRRLLATDLDAQSPWARIEPPHAGNDTAQPGNWIVTASQHRRTTATAGVAARRAAGRGRQPCRASRWPAIRRAVSPSCPAGRARLRQIGSERHAGALFDRRGGELDAGVGVDPPTAWLGDRLGPVRRVAAGMGEQVAQRAARLTDRVVETDRSPPRRRPSPPSRTRPWSATPDGTDDRGRRSCRRPRRRRRRRRRRRWRRPSRRRAAALASVQAVRRRGR